MYTTASLVAASIFAFGTSTVSGQAAPGRVDQFRCAQDDACEGINCRPFTFPTQECLPTQEAHYAILTCSGNMVNMTEYSTNDCSGTPDAVVQYGLDECLLVGTGSLKFTNCRDVVEPCANTTA